MESYVCLNVHPNTQMLFRLKTNRRVSAIVMKNILAVQILVDRSCRITDILIFTNYIDNKHQAQQI